MTDIVERLRTRNGRADGFGLGPVCDEAAAEIERLRAALAAPPVDPVWVLVPVELLNLCESMVKLHDRHGCILTVDMEVMTNLLMSAAAPTDSTARDVWNDRAALAQPAASGEPVAWRWPTPKLKGVEWRYTAHKTRPNAQPLYAAPGAPDAQKGT